MKDDTATSEYWTNRYRQGATGWDIGTIAQPLKAYFGQLQNKAIEILIPGAGAGHEAVFLFQNGFQQVHYLDFSQAAAAQFHSQCPDFPAERIHCNDFFQFQGQFDLIIEHTFFSALPRHLRNEYANHMHQLLKPKGKLVGLFFNHEFDHEGPPHGGSIEEYHDLFDKSFIFKMFDVAFNSIRPRQGREHFLILEKK